jgi:DNA-binding transcriptional LysR family regulator
LFYPGIDLRHFRYVIALADELHFSRAALRLHVAQPSLSKQIRELEQQLGVTLFVRTKRSVELTRAGKVFAKEASRALIQSERAIQLTKETGATTSRVLSIGYSPRINMKLVSFVRSVLLSRRTDYRCLFVSSETPDQIKALLRGSLDFGLIALPAKHTGLVVMSLLREKLAVVVSDAHPLARKTELCVRELNGFPVISISRVAHPDFYDQLHRMFRRQGYVPNIVQEVTTEAEAIHMAREGIGITFLKPSSLFTQTGGLACCRLREPFAYEETGIAFRRASRSTEIQECTAAIRAQIGRFDQDRRTCEWSASDSCADRGQMSLFLSSRAASGRSRICG